MTDYRKLIESLSPAQRKAFERICDGLAPDVSRITMNALLRTGLARTITKAPKPGLLPVVVGYHVEPEARLAWQHIKQERMERQLADRDHCSECGAEMFYIENRRVFPNGHGRSVPDKRAPKEDKRRLEIVPAKVSLRYGD